MLNKTCTRTAKSAPYPPFPANDKLQPNLGNLLWPELRRVTQPPHIAGYGEHMFNQIARDIISSNIAVFETSDLNPNVMIEMGVALTWGKRVVPLKQKDRLPPPSDISGQTYLNYLDSGATFESENHDIKMIAMIERAIQKKQ